ncbi:MAG: flagellar hook-associated protein FlgK [Pseudomonadota bacterium]|nr:flagellar hook-associated protein FlgK [Pseudomonadota bacterium]
MSLIGALNNTFAGLKDTEARLNVTSQNVTNADKAGYTRKVYNSEYSTTDFSTIPSGGTIDAAFSDPYLQKAMIEDTSDAGKHTTVATYLEEYANNLGKISSQSTISSAIDGIAAALDGLSVTPEDDSLKVQVVNEAERVAYELTSLSDNIQDLRARADQEIGNIVDEINASLQRLDEINVQITLTGSTGRSVAELEDQRRTELEKLAENMDINYFVDNNNQVNIYSGGRPLLDSAVHQLDYTAASNVAGSTLYPAGFSPIDLNGTDITTLIKGGELAGLIDVRDSYLVEEQEKLDEFATALMDTMNALLNEGAPYSARTEIVGDEIGFAAADPLGGTGFVRIAMTDTTGTVQSFTDFDLTAYATVNDMINAINVAFGGDITASLDVDGRLNLVSNVATQGISLNQLDSDIGGESFSMAFGLNGMFDGDGAEDITVSSYLLANATNLATSRLSSDPALVVGDVGISPGDGSLSKELNEALSSTLSFNAAGNFSAQSETLDRYIYKLISNIAVRASNAADAAETSTLVLEQTKTTFQNLTGVNVDEEMTNLIDLEAKYAASARMMSTIQQMFDELINAVR